MPFSCRILVVCDDDLLGHEIRQAIGSSVSIVDIPAVAPPFDVTLTYHDMVLRGTWEMPVRGPHFDLAIVSMLGGTGSRLRANPLLPETIPAALYLIDPRMPQDEVWNPRPGCRDQVLIRPCEIAALRAQVVEMLRVSLANRSVVDEAMLLSFLRERIEHRHRRMTPMPGRFGAGLSPHQEVSRWFGPDYDPQAILNTLVDQELATPYLVDRVRACPKCALTHLLFSEVCPACSSPDFERVPVIHHFACGHTDVSQRFGTGDDLTCPKCAKPLRQIGRDYERPVECQSCRACGTLASELKIVVRCASCRHVCTPETTAECLVHGYELTQRADEAVAAGTLATSTLESVLARRSGVCTKTLLLFELDREIARHQRYATPSALLVVRLDGMEQLRAQGLQAFAQHLERSCAAITRHLRNLDLIAIWSDDTLAILLPETPPEGADIVASRMESGIAAISPPPSTLRATVAISSTAAGFTSAAEMVAACISSDALTSSASETIDLEPVSGISPVTAASDTNMPVVVLEDETKTYDEQMPSTT